MLRPWIRRWRRIASRRLATRLRSRRQWRSEKAAGRLRLRPQPAPGNTLADAPPMDPALEAYRQSKAGHPAPQPAPVIVSTLAPAPAQTPAPMPARNEG